MKYSFIMISIVTLLLTGCTQPRVASNERLQTVYTPDLNTIATAEVGQNMFSKVHAEFNDPLAVKNKKIIFTDRKEHLKLYNLYPKMLFIKKDNNCFVVDRGVDFLIDYDCNGVFTHEIIVGIFDYSTEELTKPLEYKVEDVSNIVVDVSNIVVTESSFKREVLYQGKIANRIKITFREFIAHYDQNSYKKTFMIRDAFTQTIEYELDAEGKALLGFKGLRIEVLEATNMNIKYKVLQDFND